MTWYCEECGRVNLASNIEIYTNGYKPHYETCKDCGCKTEFVFIPDALGFDGPAMALAQSLCT